MQRLQLWTLAACLVLGFGPGAETCHAHPRSGISLGINFGVPFYRPYYYPTYGYVRPYPIYYAPPPVIYEAAPVVVGPAPAVRAVPAVVPAYSSPATESPPVIVTTTTEPQGNFDIYLQRLRGSDEGARRDAAMELGRAKVQRAVEPLTATLAGDQSPAVRDAAARALGLIASPRALTALIHAAQADNDRDVRHSAQFAVEIIRTNLK